MYRNTSAASRPGLLLVLLLFTLLPAVLASPYQTSYARPINYWRPTADIYNHRCASPTQVEFSKWDKKWYPSAICVRDTCCSNLSDGPLCTKEACKLATVELERDETEKKKMAEKMAQVQEKAKELAKAKNDAKKKLFGLGDKKD